MRLIEVHVCPLWELPDGERRVGMEYDPRGGEQWPVVGWVNVLVLRAFGRDLRLLAVAA